MTITDDQIEGAVERGFMPLAHIRGALGSHIDGAKCRTREEVRRLLDNPSRDVTTDMVALAENARLCARVSDILVRRVGGTHTVSVWQPAVSCRRSFFVRSGPSRDGWWINTWDECVGRGEARRKGQGDTYELNYCPDWVLKRLRRRDRFELQGLVAGLQEGACVEDAVRHVFEDALGRVRDMADEVEAMTVTDGVRVTWHLPGEDELGVGYDVGKVMSEDGALFGFETETVGVFRPRHLAELRGIMFAFNPPEPPEPSPVPKAYTCRFTTPAEPDPDLWRLATARVQAILDERAPDHGPHRVQQWGSRHTRLAFMVLSGRTDRDTWFVNPRNDNYPNRELNCVPVAIEAQLMRRDRAEFQTLLARVSGRSTPEILRDVFADVFGYDASEFRVSRVADLRSRRSPHHRAWQVRWNTTTGITPLDPRGDWGFVHHDGALSWFDLTVLRQIKARHRAAIRGAVLGSLENLK